MMIEQIMNTNDPHPMPATSSETLHRLRRTVADLTGVPGEDGRLVSFGVASLDQALAGGLACGALHEIGPALSLIHI